jgi:hypothetical protein
MNEELKKEWESSFDKEFNEDFWYWIGEGIKQERDEKVLKIKDFIRFLLAKQQEEFVKELATIKRWVMTIRDTNVCTEEDEYVIREKDLQRVLADFKSKLK